MSEAQDADELALIGDARLQARDGVRVQVTRDGHLTPWPWAVFLLRNYTRKYS